MSYKNLIDRFWIEYSANKLGINTIGMFFYLLEVCEMNKGNSFFESDGKLSEMLCISRQTVKVTREILQDHELIKVTVQNGRSPFYTILEDKSDKKAKVVIVPKEESDLNIPSFQEFLEFAKTLFNYDDESLNLFIEHKYLQWKEMGWKNAQNRPLTDWRASLKAAMPFLIESKNKKLIPTIKRP